MVIVADQYEIKFTTFAATLHSFIYSFIHSDGGRGVRTREQKINTYFRWKTTKIEVQNIR